MSKFNTNNFRLFVKGLVTAWVPVAALLGWISWDTTTTAVIMGASTFTIDGLFRVFGVNDTIE